MELSYSRNNDVIDEIIDGLIGKAGDISSPEILREMIITSLKAGQESDRKLDLKVMNSSLKEMRFTSKVFSGYRGVRKVSVFGSARTGKEDPLYRMARDFGKSLKNESYMIITGGGPGIMEAVMEGAGPENSFGVSIRLPFEEKAGKLFEGSPRNINYKYFFNRKVAFLKEADAVALFPGGFGTLDEAMETLTLVQTGKRNPVVMVLVDRPGGSYWKDWLGFMKDQLLGGGYISQPDLALFETVYSVDEAVELITRFHSRYHSLRYVGEKLVIRLKTPVPAGGVEELRKRFSHILAPGGTIGESPPLPEEADEPETSALPRLVLNFNRKDFAVLRLFIDAINSF